MRGRWAGAAAAASLVLAAAGPAAGLLAQTGPASAADAVGEAEARPDRAARFTFAVIGDAPYGDAQVAAFPGQVDQINADPATQLVVHLGDIKSGSSVCSDEYFAFVREQFDRFADPLVYTPGDNEWTDCHRPNNGAYDPLERLSTLRSVFFDEPGVTLGAPVEVDSQAEVGFPENVAFTRARVAFAAVHVVGSNDGLAPWTGATTAGPAQTAEVLERTAAAVQQIRDVFRLAERRGDRAVVLLTQTDMFDPTVAAPTYEGFYGFQPIVRAIAQEAAAFDGPVHLFNGDSHVYNADQPLAAGSPWLALYGVQPVPNLHRTTVEGSTDLDEWLRVTVDRRDPRVIVTERVPFA